MSNHEYETDVAVTSEGNVLAKFHQHLLVFDDFAGLDKFIDQIKAQRDVCASKVLPLDELVAKTTSEEVIEWLEGEAKKLSSPKKAVRRRKTKSTAKKGDTSTMIMDALVTFFQEDDWKVEQREESLRAQVAGNNGAWQFYAYAREKAECALFYSVCPVFAPESKRAQAAEYITRANQGLYLGNFELDYDDGEIRYKTSIDVEGHELVSPLIKQLVRSNISMMDLYLPGIMKVIYTDTSPEKEIKEIEAG
jgi:hypothetical protein